MNARNYICWAVALSVYAALLFWGLAEPLAMQRGARSRWSRLWQASQAAPLPGKPPQPLAVQRPPPPPPPPATTRKQAEELIGISGSANCADAIIPRLQRSIRVGTLEADAMSELPKGASRMASVADLPADFQWPRMKGQPLDLLAQLQMTDIAPLDEDKLLPKTGWLCFFYASDAEPPATGRKPEDRAAWKVAYFDGDPNTLQRVPPPAPLKEKFIPYKLRFWKEWTLPSLSEEPRMLHDDRCGGYYYADLCEALTGRPDEEAGWHHLLGHPQHYGGPMPPICQLASGGTPVRPKMDPNNPKFRAALASANDWVLLFQVQPGALEPADFDPNQPRRHLSASASELYFWIKKTDLAARKFDQVWMLRGGYFEEYDEDANEEATLPLMADEGEPE